MIPEFETIEQTVERFNQWLSMYPLPGTKLAGSAITTSHSVNKGESTVYFFQIFILSL